MQVNQVRGCNSDDVLEMTWQGMSYRFFNPPKPLQPFVNSMVEVTGKPKFPTVKNVPVAKSEVVFNLNSYPITGRTEGAIEWQTCEQTIFWGTYTTTFEVYAPEPLHMFVINIKPEVFQQLLGFPVTEITDRIVEGELHQKQMNSICEQMRSAKTPLQRYFIAGQWLLNKLEGKATDICENQMVAWMKSQLECNPTLPISSLENEAGYSRQYLHRLFREHVGVSPKFYQEMKRINRIIDDMKLGNFESLGSLAHRHNYYDQNHFIKSFKRFTGSTPGNMIQHCFHRLPRQKTVLYNPPG